ncbi:MAG: glycosyltransferase family 2 protein [Bacteroidota bacterium]
MTKLSICIPTYNQGVYLNKCLDPLISQSVPPYEIVVSENHSTDDTKNILYKYSNEIRIVHPPTHLSMIENYQFCAEHADGDWLIFMTSDDIAEKNYVYDILKGIKERPNSILFRGWHSEINSNGDFLRKVPSLRMPYLANPRDAFIEQFDGPKCFFEATAFLKTAWEKAGGFNTKLKLYGDWALWIALSHVGSFARIEKYLTKYRIWERYDRGINRIKPHLEDSIIIFKEMIFPKAQEYGSDVTSIARKKGKKFGYETLLWINNNANHMVIRDNIKIIQEFCDLLDIRMNVKKLLDGHYAPPKSYLLRSNLKRLLKKNIIKCFY